MYKKNTLKISAVIFSLLAQLVNTASAGLFHDSVIRDKPCHIPHDTSLIIGYQNYVGIVSYGDIVFPNDSGELYIYSKFTDEDSEFLTALEVGFNNIDSIVVVVKAYDHVEAVTIPARTPITRSIVTKSIVVGASLRHRQVLDTNGNEQLLYPNVEVSQLGSADHILEVTLGTDNRAYTPESDELRIFFGQSDGAYASLRRNRSFDEQPICHAALLVIEHVDDNPTDLPKEEYVGAHRNQSRISSIFIRAIPDLSTPLMFSFGLSLKLYSR